MVRSDAAPAPGLRERKKAETREALRSAAARLFAQRGFAETTVAEIVEAAGVSPRTFFRYFDSKEDLLLPDLAASFDRLVRELERRPIEEPPLVALREAVLAAVANAPQTTLIALAQPFAGAEAVVTDRLVYAFVQLEGRLTRLLAQRLPPGPDADLRAAVIAMTAMSAMRAVVRTVRERRKAEEVPVGAFARLLPTAFAVLAETSADL
ncbi:TetR family transcriptional regulator [Streptomyces kaniharaensis]|uniref:TetR family transcriptional regulator n=1 Tax=Streptomyces kaniharaensis TaxID=212423 RepID=A0A6N7L3B4_9ACTN|nr:TetR/AcrR family transcriptional regulator [Streptomyces kaniharaensis]MQS17028.1 TetR family transcriptional regulator [Streptomyces kaniharaensis]